MKREIIPFTNEKAWLAERAKDITSTEVSALFGVNPWLTEFELWHKKKNGIVEGLEKNESMEIGIDFEAPIAKFIAKKEGFKIKPKKHYIRLVGLGIGSSFDYEILKPFEAIFEIKNVGENSFREYWKEDGDNIEAPVNLEFQFQHELLVSGAPLLVCGAMIGGNRRKILKRVPDEKVHQAIIEKCESFRKSIKDNVEPKPDFERDAAFIAKLFNKADKGLEIEASKELSFSARCYRDLQISRDEKQALMDQIKAEILMGIGKASKVRGENFSISLGETKGSSYTVERKPGRMFRIFWKDEKEPQSVE